MFVVQSMGLLPFSMRRPPCALQAARAKAAASIPRIIRSTSLTTATAVWKGILTQTSTTLASSSSATAQKTSSLTPRRREPARLPTRMPPQLSPTIWAHPNGRTLLWSPIQRTSATWLASLLKAKMRTTRTWLPASTRRRANSAFSPTTSTSTTVRTCTWQSPAPVRSPIRSSLTMSSFKSEEIWQKWLLKKPSALWGESWPQARPTLLTGPSNGPHASLGWLPQGSSKRWIPT